jgi:hypothetical protein
VILEAVPRAQERILDRLLGRLFPLEREGRTGAQRSINYSGDVRRWLYAKAEGRADMPCPPTVRRFVLRPDIRI